MIETTRMSDRMMKQGLTVGRNTEEGATADNFHEAVASIS